jgi:hypothetical protein
MGLDMYLYSAPKIEGMDLDEILAANAHLAVLEKENMNLYQKVKGYIKHFEEYDYSWDSLLTKVAYWRKANQIHRWFVENVQNGKDECEVYEVNINHLILLCNYCDMILKGEAEPWDVLPTSSGFFFGSTDYDRFYFKEIRETHHTLDVLIQNFPFKINYLLYQSSW